MLTRHSSIYPVIIPAGANGRGFLSITGSNIHILRATGPVNVKIDDQPEVQLLAGQSLNMYPGDTFSRIEFGNPAGTRMLLDVWAGYTEFIDNRLEQIPAMSEIRGTPAIIVPANGKLDFPGNPAETRLFRRDSITVSNNDPANPLSLVDGTGEVFGIVRAGETITHHTAGYVGVKNNTADNIPVAIGENWWVF
ncbi:MAG: hypothetical protein LBK99_01570 [Opitutaceae bacterium]|jgi:hypothetical protein|nr:hypothetical protein [Opitutaceae bacterium]